MTMSSLSKPLPCLYGHSNPIHAFPTPVILHFSFHRTPASTTKVCCALKTESEEFNLLRKSVDHRAKELSSEKEGDSEGQKYNSTKEDDDEEEEEEDDGGEEEDFEDWEEQILEDTIPLVGFVRMILHSRKYEIGDRLSPDHQRIIVDRLLPYHPEFEKKIGCGLDYIMLGNHPDYSSSRCMFIVRTDGESIDFSYWKCIKGLIKKKYPLYADSFILRHFGKQRQK
ncbi:Protein DCL, chloroplastic [Linum perenne]